MGSAALLWWVSPQRGVEHGGEAEPRLGELLARRRLGPLFVGGIEPVGRRSPLVRHRRARQRVGHVPGRRKGLTVQPCSRGYQRALIASCRAFSRRVDRRCSRSVTGRQARMSAAMYAAYAVALTALGRRTRRAQELPGSRLGGLRLARAAPPSSARLNAGIQSGQPIPPP
jgi:hypothetical protein